MIRTAITLISLAGLTSTVAAQNFSLTLVPSAETIDTSAGAVTMTVTVIGDADVGTHMLGGVFGIQTDSASIIDMQWQPAIWSTFNEYGGYSGNGNYNQTLYAQFFPDHFPLPDSSLLGNRIGSFQVTIAADQVGQAEMSIFPGDPFAMETHDEVSGRLYRSSDGNLTLNGTTLTFVPTPGAASLLAIGALAITRRRR